MVACAQLQLADPAGERRRALRGRRLEHVQRDGSVGWSLSLKENHDLRGAEGPHTHYGDAAGYPPAFGRIAVERLLQVLRTELAGPPTVFFRQHLIFHRRSTS